MLYLESPQFTSIYYRYFVNTTFISTGGILFFLVIYVVGFTFVSVVNLQNQRANPFIGADGTYGDIKFNVILTCLMFAFAGMVTLRQKDDLSNYCKSNTLNLAFNNNVEKNFNIFNLTHAELSSDKPLQQIFASIDMMDYLTKREQTQPPECHLYSNQEVFNYNYYIWTAAYFVGLQFTHLDTGVFQQLTLDWNVMKNWPQYMWVIFLGIVALISTIVAYIFYLYSLIGYLNTYVTLITSAVGVISFLTSYYSLWGYHLHIHHWFLGAFV